MSENMPAVAKKASLIEKMAGAASIEPRAFIDAVKSTCISGSCTDSQFAAFLMVCDRYRLDPLTKQVYAYPGKSGGIVPFISVDGWIGLANNHPQMDGMTFKENLTADNKLESVTCTIYRKDRSHPVEVTEYYEECKRNTAPWTGMPRRQLRHKALMQGSRIAFGFSGLYDEDEAKDIIDAECVDVTPTPPAPPTGRRRVGQPKPAQSEKVAENAPDGPSELDSSRDEANHDGADGDDWRTLTILKVDTAAVPAMIEVREGKGKPEVFEAAPGKVEFLDTAMLDGSPISARIVSGQIVDARRI